jgi:hypothetical protein
MAPRLRPEHVGANTTARGQQATSPSSGGSARRYRRHVQALPDGGRLTLREDGTIERLGADGSTVGSWRPDDPDWPGQAIRFGLRPQPKTVAPQGQRIADTRLP